MKKSILILLFIPIVLISQENEYEEYDNTFGVKASNISGYGFFINQQFNKYSHLQLMGFIYYYNYEDAEELTKIFNYDIGLEYQFNISVSKFNRFYLLVGGYYYFDDEHDETLGELDSENDIRILLTENNSYNIGVGIAWEYRYKRFIFGLELGYKFYEDNLEIKEDDKAPYPELRRLTKIGGGLNFGFLF